MNFNRILLIILLAWPLCLAAQIKPEPSFKLVPLGVWGGIDESNLSAYMVAPYGSKQYICLDAGTLHAGINKAITKNTFNVPPAQVLKQFIKGYFISHSHLDHLGGLIINSPEDSTKSIYAFADCINTFKNNYFTWKSWANFADDGETPALKKYHYNVLTPGTQTDVASASMQVTAFTLSHANLISTAFLIRSKDNYLLYLGDTGCDELEKSDNLNKLWTAVAPLIKAGKLKAIMIEVSFPNDQPDKSLFGHLTPRLLMQELSNLAAQAGSLKGLNVIVTHLKPPADKILQIKQQLKAENNLGVKLIYPEQGRAINL